MTNFQSRLLLTLTVLPTVFASLFWPMKNHLIVIIVFGLAVTVFGSYEFNSLIYKKGIDVRRWFIPTVNTFIYLFAYAVSINLFGIKLNNIQIAADEDVLIFFRLRNRNSVWEAALRENQAVIL